MMTFYAAAGSYQIRSEDGKNMPYIMRLGKLQPVSIPEFSLWSMLLWDVLTYEELHKKFYDKMEETEIEPSSFDKSLEMLVKRKLIIKGVGYTGADALYNMLSDTYVIPLRGVQGTRKLMNVSLNGLEYLKNDADEVIYFAGVEAAKVYLREHGVTEDEMEDMVFRKSVGTCFRCGDPLFLSDIPEYTCQCFRCDEDFYSIEQDITL